MLQDTLKIDFEQLYSLKHRLNDSHYAEYIYHKLFDNPSYTWQQSLQDNKVWSYPECWLARYYLYYVLHDFCFKDAAVLDLGSNLNFYSIWAVLNGAQSSKCVEPDTVRFNLGKELVDIRNLNNQITCENISIDQFCQGYQGESYDTVLLLDVFYYLTNGIDILNFIKTQIKPKYLLLESTVVDDVTESGHFKLWNPSEDSLKFQLYTNPITKAPHNIALTPSRNALNNIVCSLGWKIISYYSYSDFIGHGESPPRKTGNKNFYVLSLNDN